MPTPPPEFRRLEAAYQRSDHALLVAEGDAVAAALAADPVHEQLTIPLAFMMGVAHTAYESNEAAIAYLEYGLARRGRGDATAVPTATVVDRPPTSPPPAGPPTGPPAPVGPYGVPVTAPLVAVPPLIPSRPVGKARRATFDDHAELLLVELLLVTGRTAEARTRLPALLEPQRALTTRFAATRAQSSIAALGGELETAHHFANTAAGLAGRIPSRFRAALVDADRAQILVHQGRTHEALAIADRVLDKLIRPLVGPAQVWSTTEGALLALALSRHAARGGDPLSGERLLRVGEAAATALHRNLVDGHVHLSRAVVASVGADHDGAERELVDALAVFHTYGYRPAAARAVLEQGRLAHERGLLASARPLYLSALDELRAVGHLPDAKQAQLLLAALDRGEPPPVERHASPLPSFPGPSGLPPQPSPR